MIPGTTPTLTFTIEDGVNLTLAENVYVTIEQANYSLTLSGDSVTVQSLRTVSCTMTQEESLKLSSFEGSATVQINWTYWDDVTGKLLRGATKPKRINVEKQLLKEVIS